MTPFRRLIVTFIAAALLAALPQIPQAQPYPSQNPTYIPTAVLGATSLTTAGTVTFNSNGNGTLLLRVAGTNTGLSATVQITESRASSPSWTTVGAQTVGGARVSTVTANGLYRLNVSGAAQVRFNLASVTGTNVIVSASATPGPEFMATLPATRATFGAAATITPVANAADLMTITGSASKTVRVNSVVCSGSSNGIGNATLNAIKRSTANAGGTSTSATATAFDSATPTAAATVVSYSANPTLGTTVGALRTQFITMGPATVASAPVKWDFAQTPGEQGVVLRGTGEQFSINGNGATFPTTPSLNCAIAWTEE